jgi:hypothetical protein
MKSKLIVGFIAGIAVSKSLLIGLNLKTEAGNPVCNGPSNLSPDRANLNR